MKNIITLHTIVFMSLLSSPSWSEQFTSAWVQENDITLNKLMDISNQSDANEKFEISAKLKKILQDKTIAFAIKYYPYNKKKNSDILFQRRQTRNLKKIYKLLHIICNKNINVVLLGKKKNHFIKTISGKKLIDNKKIFLFDDLSENYSIADQVYLAENASGYIGSGAGDMIFFDTLKKKTLLIDYTWVENLNLYLKNRKWLFKTVQNKKNKKIEVFNWLKVYNSKYHKLIENSYDEIYKAAKKKFNF